METFEDTSSTKRFNNPLPLQNIFGIAQDLLNRSNFTYKLLKTGGPQALMVTCIPQILYT
jgi:hypothetical protein